jgi:hypothetical protein
MPGERNMCRISSDRPLSALLLGAALVAVPAVGHAQLPGRISIVTPAAAQEAPGNRIVSSEIAVSRDAAELRLELDDGRTLNLQLAEDRSVRLNNARIGTYERRGELDRSWRDLLQAAMDAPTGALAGLLSAWEPPAAAGTAGERLARELGDLARPATGQTPAMDPPADAGDTIQRLNERIRELERVLQDPDALPPGDLDALDLPALRELRQTLEADLRTQIRQELRAELRRETRQQATRSPFRHITRGITGVFSTFMAYAVLVGLGFLAVFFGRTYLETIADTARRSTLRAGLVGLAGSFLVLPAFILGALALAISIVGIPLLLVYLPLFPLAVVLAAVGGYLAVAHGAGEALAERRFRGTEWFSRANSYYFVTTGVGLLLVLFFAAHIVTMAGPWLGFLQGLLKFVAIMVTWAAFMIGFGAFLLSRGGTRPTGDPGTRPLEEEIHV